MSREIYNQDFLDAAASFAKQEEQRVLKIVAEGGSLELMRQMYGFVQKQITKEELLSLLKGEPRD